MTFRSGVTAVSVKNPVDGSKSLPPSHCGILLYSNSPSALSAPAGLNTSKSLIHPSIYHSLEESEEWSTQWSEWSSCSEGQHAKFHYRINPKTDRREGAALLCKPEFRVKGKDYEIPATGKDYTRGRQRFKWSSWSSCSEGQKYKHRTRINHKKGIVEGEEEICVSFKVGPGVHRGKNGRIMLNKGRRKYQWSSWSSCSEGQEYKHRTRINPKKGKMEGQSEICVSSKVGPGWHQGKGAENLSS